MFEFNETFEKRFWSKVKKTESCWEWTAFRNHAGYGRINANNKKSSKGMAHRMSYQLHYGPFPDELHVLHKCDNPACVRPDHLFLGTHQDNMADMREKGRDNRYKFSEGTIQTILSLRDEQWSLKRIGQAFGVDKRVIRRILKEAGRDDGSLTDRAFEVIIGEKYPYVIEYRRKGLSLREIGEKFGVDKDVIKRALTSRRDYSPLKPGPRLGTSHRSPLE